MLMTGRSLIEQSFPDGVPSHICGERALAVFYSCYLPAPLCNLCTHARYTFFNAYLSPSLTIFEVSFISFFYN